jgi:hypothetical protein
MGNRTASQWRQFGEHILAAKEYIVQMLSASQKVSHFYQVVGFCHFAVFLDRKKIQIELNIEL